MFVVLSHGGSVIPNYFANFRSHDNLKFFYEVGEIFIFSHVAYEMVENLKKPLEYGYHLKKNILLNFIVLKVYFRK